MWENQCTVWLGDCVSSCKRVIAPVTWLQWPSTTEVDSIPWWERSYVDRMSFIMLLILSSRSVLKATAEPEANLTSNAIKPWKKNHWNVHLKTKTHSLRGARCLMEIDNKDQLTTYIGWPRVVRLFKSMRCKACWIRPCRQNSSSISDEWQTCSPILIKQVTTLSTSWKKTYRWQWRSDDVNKNAFMERSYLNAYTKNTCLSSYWRRLHKIGMASMKGERDSEVGFLHILTTVESATL